ncbi:MAG TPA: HepT-like ribonuclease domain-containing protein [Bryobacteraceae bacterium]|nr:HepT-like ribonuclease domain-containing protein [Bryobacteraceae bacterium]
MRHEAAFLQDILSACRKIEGIVAATTEDYSSRTGFGEAISRLSVELRDRHPEVPWRQIIAARHRIVHAYFDLDWQILWDVATGDVPPGFGGRFSISSQG